MIPSSATALSTAWPTPATNGDRARPGLQTPSTAVPAALWQKFRVCETGREIDRSFSWMHDVKTRLLTDTFQYAKPNSEKRKATSGANNTKTRNPKAGTPQSRKAKAPRPRLTEDQKRENGRKSTAERRKRLKEQGCCKDCPNPAPTGHTRCPDCAEKHRKYSEQYRRAQGVQPRQRVDHNELLEVIQKEIATKTPKRRAKHPRGCATKHTSKKAGKLKLKRVPNAYPLAFAWDAANPALKAKLAVRTAY